MAAAPGPAPMLAPRLPDWRGRLAAYLARVASEPAASGSEVYCAVFAAGAVEAMTGTPPAAAWLGRTTDLREALAGLRADGHADHEALVAWLYPEISPAFAQVGDLAVLDGEGGVPVLGVITGARIALMRADGLASLPLMIEADGEARTTARRVMRP